MTIDGNSTISIITILGLAGLALDHFKEKGRDREDLGKLKQQVKSLETRAGLADTRFSSIESQYTEIREQLARLEALLTQRL